MDHERRRVLILFAALAVGAVLIIARLVMVDGVEHDHWLAVARATHEHTIEIAPRRGTIYDRNGVPLAFDVKASAIAVDSFNMTKPETLISILSQALHRPRADIAALVYRRSYFTWIDRSVDLETAKWIQAQAQQADVNGLIFINTWKRCYPEGDLASNVIGFVGTDGHGLEGIELYYDKQLSGTPTVVHVVRGADGRTYDTETLEQGKPGADIHLTLDTVIQHVCEDAISRGVSQFRANAGFIIVLDPHTGAVLAMAQNRRYDLNKFYQSTPAMRKNLAVSFMFEPGSTFKAFSGLAALQAGVVTPADRFNGNDGIDVAGHIIHNSENESFGSVSFADIIQDSINTGMIRVVQRLGQERLYQFLVSLGFGKRTGITLPGEIDGILRPVNEWSKLALAETSIGQSVGVTGIQLARAMAAVANGGLVLKPEIVEQIGAGPKAQPIVIRRIAAQENCDKMRALLRLVVEKGTATKANIPGFDVAGKTGTAQKAIPGKGYVPGKYTSLFCGFFPKDDPKYLALVVLDEVHTWPVWGGDTAGQIFHTAMARVALITHLPPVAQR